jgi:hypothetical protein
MSDISSLHGSAGMAHELSLILIRARETQVKHSLFLIESCVALSHMICMLAQISTSEQVR